MSLFVLDTDILSLLQEGHPGVLRRVGEHSEGEVATTAITIEEQLGGWYALLRRPNRKEHTERVYSFLIRTVQYLARFPILNLTVAAQERRESLERLRLNVKRPDLSIAAIVLERGATLVTRNVRDFQRVPGLVYENWAD